MKSISLRKIHQKKEDLLRYMRPLQAHLLREMLTQVHPAEMAEIFRLMNSSDLETLLPVMDDERLRSTLRFLHTDRELRLMVLRRIPRPRLTNLCEPMSPTSLADLVDGFSESDIEEFLGLLNPAAARDVRDLLRTSTGGLGRLLTKDFLRVSDTLTIDDVLGMIRDMKHTEGRPHEVYVADSRGMLAGVLDLHDMLLETDTHRPLRHVMKECIARIPSDMPPDAAARTVLYYGLGSAPVVDPRNHILGVIPSSAAFSYLEKLHEEHLNGIMGFPLFAGFTEKEAAPMMLKRSTRLLMMLTITTAACALLALLVVLLPPGRGMLRAIPLIPLVLGAARLFYRHTALLLEDRGMGKVWATTFKPRYIRIGILLGLAFCVPVGALSFLLQPRPAFALAAGLSLAFAVVAGSLMALGAHAAVARLRIGRGFLLSPAFLPVCDLVSVAAAYTLFAFLLR